MHGVEFFRDGSQLLAIVVRASATSDDKYNFLTDQTEPLQVGVNFYRAGETIKSHSHLPREILVRKVQEALLISRGRTRITLYDDRRQRTADTVLATGDIVVLLSGGHGFEILEDTKIVEVKQGPYDGKTQDKVPL